jgi:predicted helicase
LVKHPNKPKDEKAKIYYHDIGDYLTREDKLRIVKNFGDISNPLMKWTEIAPNEHGDWISHRNEMFKLFTILGDKDDKKNKQTFFVPYYSSGLKTQRDAWCYNSSLPIVKEAAKMQIDFYNEQRELLASGAAKDVVYSHKINWTAGALNDVLHNKHYTIDDCQYRTSLYRPFFKQHQLWYKPLNERQYQMPKLFPTPKHENLVICVSGIGASKDFSTLITDCIPDLQLQFNGQCFPLYWYDDSTADIADLFSQASGNEMDKYIRRDGITDWIRATARKQYGSKVDKEDIFYYVYGILHSPDYRTTFASDLKKSLPRLPLVESKEDFWAFSKAGRELAALHLNYETIEPYKGCIPVFGAYSNKGEAMNYRVEKMRFGKIDSKTADKSVIHYNSAITISNIPLEAYEYVVNGKSAIEWIMERYAVTTDTKSGITNDPNDWAKEHDDEKYIYNLLLRVINVSIQTMEIVKSLPKLKFEE